MHLQERYLGLLGRGGGKDSGAGESNDGKGNTDDHGDDGNNDDNGEHGKGSDGPGQPESPSGQASAAAGAPAPAPASPPAPPPVGPPPPPQASAPQPAGATPPPAQSQPVETSRNPSPPVTSSTVTDTAPTTLTTSWATSSTDLTSSTAFSTTTEPPKLGTDGDSSTTELFPTIAHPSTTSALGKTASSMACGTGTSALPATSMASSSENGQLSKAAIDAIIATSVVGSILIGLVAFCIFWRRRRRRNVARANGLQRSSSQTSQSLIAALPSFLSAPLVRLSSVHLRPRRHSPPPGRVPSENGNHDMTSPNYSNQQSWQPGPKPYAPSAAAALSSNPPSGVKPSLFPSRGSLTPLYTVQRASSGRLIAKPAPVAARLRGAADRLEALIMRHDSSWYGESQRGSDNGSDSSIRFQPSASGEVGGGWRASGSTDEVHDEKGALLDGFELVRPAEQQEANRGTARLEGGVGLHGLDLEEWSVKKEREKEDEDGCVSPLESDTGRFDRVSTVSSDVPTEGREIL